MLSYYEELSGSDSDSDSGFEEDMEALRRACKLTGATDTIDDDIPQSSNEGGFGGGFGGDDNAADESEDGDLELVRSIERQFSAATADFDVGHQAMSMKPLKIILPPGMSDEKEDYEDDLETFRAIQRRFSQYNDSISSSTGSFSGRLQQVGDGNIAFEKETSNNLFVKRINNDGQGFPDCVDGRGTTQNMDFPSNFTLETPFSNANEWNESGGELVPVTDSGFPRSAQAFVDAVKKNRLCQKLIQSKLIQLEARIEENRKLKVCVKTLKDFQVACRRRTGRALSQKKDARVQLISVPKQRANTQVKEKKIHPIYHGPAENSHVANYRDAMSKYPFSVRREKEPWTKEEKENLVKGIKQQFQEMLMQNLFCDGAADSNNLDCGIEQIRGREITPEEIKSFLYLVNWEQLSLMYVPGRSGAECEGRWLNCEDPLINRQPWSKAEDKKLLHILQEDGINNWFVIARQLGTNRTPFQCLTRFQRSLNSSIMKRDWTPSEDEDLHNAVAEYGESNWQLVASTLDGRTGTQCSNRWKKSLNPLREKVGKWTPDEDKRLKIAVMLFGAKSWNKMARFVPGRTQVQCRERWVNCLDPSLNLGKWTEEEDTKLKAAILEHGHCWSRVAACIPPRTDSQCRRRWKVLLPDEVPVLQELRKVQKAAFISNFVDREEERPAIEPGDFILPRKIQPALKYEQVHSRGENKKRRLMPVSNGGGSSSGSIPAIRSRRARKVTHTEKVLSFTDGKKVENDHGHAGAGSNERAKNKRLSKKNKTTTSSRDTRVLDLESGKGFNAFDGDKAEMKKKATKQWKQKPRGSKEPEISAVSKKKTAVSKKKTARANEGCASTSNDSVEADEIQALCDDRAMIAKRIKPCSPSSPLDTYALTMEAGEIPVTIIKGDASIEPPCSYSEVVERINVDDEVHGYDDNVSLPQGRPANYAAPSTMDCPSREAPGGPRVRRCKKKSKKSSNRDRDDNVDDEMTLALFIRISGKCPVRSNAGKEDFSLESTLPVTSVASKKKAPRVRKRSDLQTSEVQEDEEMTLASFQSKVKKLKLERGKDA